ncbi:MAG TPA: efflux RND transporter periplasmic adaptor subunit [Bacteroidota bacterium]|nr:efflux RND transporter periplasmic adaptor subunit [Bacteroidota bacterium]
MKSESRKEYIAAALLIACGAALVSCGSRTNDPRPGGPAAPDVMSVSGVVVRPAPLENIVRSSGTVMASESVDLVAESAGRVEKIAFREGGHVGKGRLLVKINDDDLQAQLRKTSLQIQLASDQEERQRQLFEKSAVSREQYDIALNLVNTLKADRDNIVSSIRKREIRAPFDGVAGLRYVSEGGYVTQATRIASLQKINPLKVDFAIPEKYAGQVAVGDLVEFSSEDSRLRFTGKLYALEPKIDPAMGTLQLRAMCDNPAGKIFPGAFVHIDLRLRTIQDALMVPTQAVIPVFKGQTLLLQKNGVVLSVPVKTGIRNATSVQITDGIAAGDTVITTGILQLRPGMIVQVTAR